ncbi:nodulation protein NodZ [Rhizobium lentis]|uniref:Uncharacterized protein n=1 Tax=Rhizobium lentis TaxID=1138194 RepID=A0A7W9CXX0_9HYPH|nr:hypothetical protein [Rhizobium lentis]MBB5553195.1 hypothetical protein [Rhizobium lentis]MBB5563982.1 hypothetical protein [Rhizobium lentis]MBB5570280.1 hypothetical protein [Rhizobium lentis]
MHHIATPEGFGDYLWSLAAVGRYAQRMSRTLAIDGRGSFCLEPVQDIGGVPVICDEKINAPEGA